MARRARRIRSLNNAPTGRVRDFAEVKHDGGYFSGSTARKLYAERSMRKGLIIWIMKLLLAVGDKFFGGGGTG